MSGLELIALVPFGIAGWRLFQKLGDQQSVIEQHEVTISSQKEMLESIMHSDRGHSMNGWFSGAAIASAVVFAGTITYKSWSVSRPSTIRPPASYEPRTSTFEGEQCVICLDHCKDTVFLPCRHLCTCWCCAAQIGTSVCPTCRAPIEAMQFVYQQ